MDPSLSGYLASAYASLDQGEENLARYSAALGVPAGSPKISTTAILVGVVAVVVILYFVKKQ